MHHLGPTSSCYFPRTASKLHGKPQFLKTWEDSKALSLSAPWDHWLLVFSRAFSSGSEVILMPSVTSSPVSAEWALPQAPWLSCPNSCSSELETHCQWLCPCANSLTSFPSLFFLTCLFPDLASVFLWYWAASPSSAASTVTDHQFWGQRFILYHKHLSKVFFFF